MPKSAHATSDVIHAYRRVLSDKDKDLRDLQDRLSSQRTHALHVASKEQQKQIEQRMLAEREMILA